ncbi:MAG: chorismate-binding protein, partial [Rhodoferax sp.]
MKPLPSAVSALIDFADPQSADGPRLRHAFGTPRERLVAHAADQVRPVLDAAQKAAQAGAWCVGYLRYEAAPAFDPALVVRDAQGPLAWFAVYDKPLPWPQADAGAPQDRADVRVQWQSLLERPACDAALARLLAGIARGDYYQVNFTAQMVGALAGTATGSAAAGALFAALQRAQPGGYAAFLDTGDEQILSVSPELFFDWRAGHLLARPMKGTAARGATAQEDAAQALRLRTSPKEMAENVMVVDLLRNDMSRIAEPFSVRVPRLFHTEGLPSVWQMTSDVTARTRAGCSLADVFAALFPCGSVTGAPKVQAMRAIRELEPAPRGVYCGALGVIQPGGAATFNVPIRTVTVRGATAWCGIGSGITAGSVAADEWQEWQLKKSFVQRASEPFSVLETLGLLDGGWRDSDAHLARMALAARQFGYPWDVHQAERALAQLAQEHPHGAWRVRLLLDAQGRVSAAAYALPAPAARVRLQLATRPIEEAHSEFVRFKTTHRAHYDAFAPTQPGVFDTLLWNAQGEVTECTRGNIAVLLDGSWVTPPLHCGLLPGIGRARALREGRIREAVVRKEDLPR